MVPLYQDSDYRRALPIDNEERLSWRSPFRRDFARLLHSPALRRLQGKTQLFSGLESDFFRNRLTHSMEVAQIAKSIALKLNWAMKGKLDRQIDCDVVEFAGLAHDLGHPPFGHTGEAALNEIMAEHGGFEGNAQTLRILTRLEKKLDNPTTQLDDVGGNAVWFKDGKFHALGLNLCARTIAAVLKYDVPIPMSGDPGKVSKGYYTSEESVVEWVKEAVAPGRREPLKTIECQIMDIADDIAYSTYDMDDAFKAGLLAPVDLIFPKPHVLSAVADRTRKNVANKNFDETDAMAALNRCIWVLADANYQDRQDFAAILGLSKLMASDGFYRNWLTSELVNRFIDGVQLRYNKTAPSLSKVRVIEPVLEEIEVLKHFAFVNMIQSNRLRIVEHRARHIVKTIMGALTNKAEGGAVLLPPDFADMYKQAEVAEPPHRENDKLTNSCMRVICDFVAGMTDRYAVEFYCRLRSENYQTIFRDY